MCGRFFVPGESENELLDRMIAEASRRQRSVMGEDTVARGEVFPAMTVAVLAAGKSGATGAYPMIWGFRRADGKGLIINTRSETAMDRPMFRASMLERRCLVLASWYFEWAAHNAQQSLLPIPENEPPFALQIEADARKKARKNAVKVKYAIRPEGKGLIYLAGIYRYEADQKLPVFSILTREPSPEVAFIHSRMPVVFSEKTHAAWLDRSADPLEALAGCERNMAYRAV